MPDGWSEAEVLAELIERPRYALTPLPELELVDTPTWRQLTCPLFPTGGLNEVSRAKLQDEDADARIAQTVAQYRARGLRFRWDVLPDSTPVDLPARLAAHGLEALQVAAVAAPAALALDAGPLTATETDDAGLYARVMEAGWGSPAASMERLVREAMRERKTRFYLAWDGAVAVGGASAYFFERSLHLLSGVVVPQARGRGAYRALLAARLSAAREAELPLVTARAIASTSAPMLLRWGFDEWFRYPSFRDVG